MSEKPLCFVLMPFGTKSDPNGGPDINFDKIYNEAIRPGIETAGMEPIRADEERTGGIIHKAMFERLMLCDFAVADLTTANANVFYELGIRHAVRPHTTLTMFAANHPPPFDVNFLRALPYELGQRNRFGPEQAGRLLRSLTSRLEELRGLARDEATADSPVFTLLGDYQAPDIARLKTDAFRDRVRYSSRIKSALADARDDSDMVALTSIEEELGELDGVEAGILIDLFLSYRAVKAWDHMIRLYDRLPATLRRSVMVREQLAFALNRCGHRKKAIRALEELIREHGASSETCGLLGRVYKDLWVEAQEAGNETGAQGHLKKAIETYSMGFEADWRDAYPGINAVTLLDIRGDDEALKRKAEMLPVVRFAVNQRLKSSEPDYWDHATLLELAILDSDPDLAREKLGDAVSHVREVWEPETTANNLRLIQRFRAERGVDEDWLDEIIVALDDASRL